MEKIFEVRIVHKDKMSEQARRWIIGEVEKRPKDFQRNFRGFAKVTYITTSPKSISSIEPIEGTIIDYFKAGQKEGVKIPEF